MNITEKEAWRASRVRSVPQAPSQPSPVHQIVRVEADTSSIEARLSALESQVNAITDAVNGASANYAQLLDICRALDDRISSFNLKVEKAA